MASQSGLGSLGSALPRPLCGWYTLAAVTRYTAAPSKGCSSVSMSHFCWFGELLHAPQMARMDRHSLEFEIIGEYFQRMFIHRFFVDSLIRELVD